MPPQTKLMHNIWGMSKQCFTLYSKSLVCAGFALMLLSVPAQGMEMPVRGGKKFFDLANAKAGRPGGMKIASTDTFMPLGGYVKVRPSSARKLEAEKQTRAKESIPMEKADAESKPKINRKALEALFPELKRLKEDEAEAETDNENAKLEWPVERSLRQRISSYFGFRKDPFTGKHAFHKGIDIAAPIGTKVLAAAGGVVETVTTHPRLGKYVKVVHADDSYALYGHLSKTDVRAGKKVKAGDLLGKVGSSGRSTGPHLDFSLRRGEEAVNPLPLLAVPAYIKTLELSDARR